MKYIESFLKEGIKIIESFDQSKIQNLARMDRFYNHHLHNEHLSKKRKS